MKSSAPLAWLLLSAAPLAQCDEEKLWMQFAAHPDLGRGIAFSGHTLLAGYGPNQGGLLSGSVAEWRYDGDQWVFQDYLLTQDLGEGHFLGQAIAVDADVAVFGAPGHDQGAPFNGGAAYVFRLTGAGWVEEAQLFAPDPEAGDHFGERVDVSGDALAIAAPREGSLDEGSVYLFRHDGTGWAFEEKLQPPGIDEDAMFGTALDLEGDVLLVGAPFEGADRGRVYEYVRSAGTWGLNDTWTASDAQDADTFGYSVALEGDSAVVGAPGAITSSGIRNAVYAFERSAGVWSETQKLVGSTTLDGHRLGFSIAIQGDRMLAGAPWFTDAIGKNRGIAYLFRREPTTGWIEEAILGASDALPFDQYGWKVAFGGNFAAVGAPFVDNGPFSDSNVGAVYAYDLDCHLDFYGCGVNPPGSLVVLGGRSQLGDELVIGLDNPTDSQSQGTTLPFLALATAPAPGFPCGLLVPGWGMEALAPNGELLLSVVPPNPFALLAGAPWQGPGLPSEFALPIPANPLLSGAVLYAQGFLVDPVLFAAPFAATGALEFELAP